LVCGLGGQEQEIDTVIDTGFNGFLTLPPALVRQLNLPHLGQTRALLANGREEITAIVDGASRIASSMPFCRSPSSAVLAVKRV
jgi:predicted aspartyl protease